MDFKNSVLLPKTDFEMRGNLPNKEPNFQKRWDEMDIYHKMLLSNPKDKAFYLHDGPPYANGNMHCGHALNKILKDIIIKYKNMNGFYAPIIHGWDTHGMPIEVALQKKGLSVKNMSLSEFRDKCKEFALSQVKVQRGQVKRLGVFGSFGNENSLEDETNVNRPYLTLQKAFEARQIEVFANMALKGYIYKGLKTVYWSPSSQTALAEAEIEYQDIESYSIFVKFKVTDNKGLFDEDASIIIWTTTPWTIPANLALCVNPNFEYGLYKTDKGNFIVDVNLMDNVSKDLSFNDVTLLKTFKGRELEYIEAKHPYIDRKSIVILGDYVTEDSGTGIVHIAPDHGVDDFNVARKYNINPFVPIDARGCYTDKAPKEFEGLYFEDGNEVSLKLMESTNTLLKVSKFVHSYPHDWRTKKPLIQRATDQWFCSIDAFRDDLLKQIHNTNWYPSWGEVRMTNMIKDRDDWCISRQRTWGVPIPIIYNEDGSPIIEKEVFEHIASIFREKGSNAWYELDAKELLPNGYKNTKSPNGNFTKEKDIMDVWFDSGSSSLAVIEQREGVYPADLYLEGFDQYRGWFNSSLIIATANKGVAPYKNVVSHGFVLDGQGRKFSKSLGNGIDPNVMVNKYGADILRMWVASSDYQEDVRCSEEIIAKSAEVYKSIRNRFKFMLGTIDGLNKNDLVTSYSYLGSMIINELHALINNVHEYYDSYNFASALSAINNFMQIDLSSFYFDMAKDILYCDAKDSKIRLEFQSIIYTILMELTKLLAPIIPHTCEEVYDFITLKDKESIFLEKYDFTPFVIDSKLHESYQTLMGIRNDVLKALEEKRSEKIIGKSIDATANLFIENSDVLSILKAIDSISLEQFFIVSKVNLCDSSNGLTKYDNCYCNVLVNDGKTCVRCWNRFLNLDANELCPRCAKVCKGMYLYED